MKLSEIPHKRLSNQELTVLFDEIVKNLKVRSDSDRKTFGYTIKSLLSHIRWLEGEIDRITQIKFSMTNSDERATAPVARPSDPTVGRVTHAFPKSEPKVYVERGERLYTMFSDPYSRQQYLKFFANGKHESELVAEANEWAAKNNKEPLK